jgi:N-methylhydantoinase A
VRDSAKRVKTALSDLHRLGGRELRAEGFKKGEIEAQDFLDLRYRGQSYELTIPLKGNVIEQFHQTHERRYGYGNPEKDVEIVNVRTTFFGRTTKPVFSKAPKVSGKAYPVETGPVWFEGKFIKTPIYDRAELRRGHVIKGPAIIGEYSSTTWVPSGVRCEVDAYLNLILE